MTQRFRYFLSLFLASLLALALIVGLLTVVVQKEQAFAAPSADSPIRVAIVFSQDDSQATGWVGLLDGNGFSAQSFKVALPETVTLDHHLLLPLISSAPGSRTGDAPGAGIPDFTQFDLILVLADTGAGEQWSTEPGLVEAIRDSGLPVVGLGSGGHALYGKLGLDIGHPYGVAVESASVKVADYGDSQPFYTTPGGVPIPGDGVVTLFSAARSGVAVPLAERLPEGVRIASLPDNDGQFPLVKTGQRYLLWGFGGGPDGFTDAGRTLFLNSLGGQAENLTIPLRGREFTPEAGIEQDLLDALAATSLPNLHALAQLRRLPSPEEQASLADAGITLLNFIDGTTYSVTVAKNFDPNATPVAELVRWMGLYLPGDKVDPKILAGQFESWADNGDGTVNLLVSFFADVPSAEAEEALAKYAASHTAYGDQSWAVVMDKGQIVPLSQEDRVRWMEEGPAPMQIVNDVARNDLNVDAVQAATISAGSVYYAGLDGSGVNVGIFDSGINTPTFSHPDFAGRLLRTANDTNGHGSHVAGMVGASGSQSMTNCPYGGGCTDFQMRGMAPGVGLAPYWGDSAADYASAVNSLGIEVSNHSYVMTCGSYNNAARDVDKLVRGELTSGGSAILPHTIVWAACNQGTGAQYCTTGTVPDGPDPGSDPDPDPTTGPRGYWSILSPSKNQIVVGAVDRGTSFNLSGFSSRGPTWDGRLKPDVMGVGCAFATDNDTNGYVFKCGTSMASPSVAGVVALMTEQYHRSFPGAGRPDPATIKAVLIGTAVDLVHEPAQAGFAEYGWNDPDSGQPVIFHAGPDWSTGYGAVDAAAAVSAIRARNFVEDSVSPADTVDDYSMVLPAGRTDFKVTLVWSDEAGDPTKNITATQLVNDLDLTLIDPNGITFRPWVLPALPRANTYNASFQDTGVADPIVRATHILPAVRGVDRLNNVEQVSVSNPAGLQAGTWTIRVRANALPNNKTQPYSLAGDFRTLNIVEPQTGNVAEAGDPNNPNVVLVVVEAVNALTGGSAIGNLQDAVAGDFSVLIDSTPATIVSGLPVGEQFWLNVRPQAGVYSGGSKYDLSVTWTGYGSDKETRAILFTEREVADRAIILDHSGSMSDYDKMAAAQNAARLFVDQSLIGDRVAVVGFSTNASTPYTIHEVSNNPAQPELTAAKTAIDSFVPTDWTAIGKGLLAGQTEVTKAPADFSIYDVLVLLSDGMENENPLYDTPAVKGVIEPTDTIIHTVAVGPASAGHHGLLATIANQNGGTPYVVTDPGASAAAADVNAPAILGEGLSAWPATLPNRLGDTYKSIAEEVLDEVRLFQAYGMADRQSKEVRWTIEVPDGLQRITFAVNWAIAGQTLRLQVEDPDGNIYRADGKNPLCRDDATHQTCIIEKVPAGKWILLVSFVETSNTNEYVVWASARTQVGFQLFVGTPEAERVVHRPIQLLGVLHQGGKPLIGQTVQVHVYAPYASGGTKPGAAAVDVWPLTLYDDGMHGDGQAKDGIYGAQFIEGHWPGPYEVRGMAQGTDLNGQPFTLYRNTSFHLKPRALYIYRSDDAKGQEVKALLQANGIGVDVVQMNSVPTADMTLYNLVIVGPDTGYLTEWGTPEAVAHIRQYEKAVLGMGEGGYAFFGKLGLHIGSPNGAHGDGTSIIAQRVSDSIWRYPYEFQFRDEFLKLYEKPSGRVDILLNESKEVQVFGLNDTDQRYGDLLMESNFWMLWGFDDGPSRMTATGRMVFVNAAHRTLR